MSVAEQMRPVRWGGRRNDHDSELDDLCKLVEDGWAWQWPGWKWVAKSLNHWHGNHRTPAACRAKYFKVNPPPAKGETK